MLTALSRSLTDAEDLSSEGTRLSLDPDTGLEKGLEVGDEADQRLFVGIRVADTKISGVKGDYYVEYRVTYDGLFEMVETVASSKTTVSCLVRQEVSVWRRFSEFITLHQQLEGSLMLRPFLKKIDNPVRLKTVTSIFGSKLSRNVTIQRSMFLVRYMNKLADIPMIANSPPFRLFLAYDSDAGGKVSKLASSKSSVFRSLVPTRLDKVITDGIRGAVTIIKNVIPIESYQDGYFAFFSSPSVRGEIETRFGTALPLSGLMTPEVIDRLIHMSGDPSSYSRQDSHLSTNHSIHSPCDNSEVQSIRRDQKSLVSRDTVAQSGCRSVDMLLQLFELIRSEGQTASGSVPLYILKSLLGDFLES